MESFGIQPWKRSLYLHIGSEKTGTSSLHKFLARNREELARANLTYFTDHPRYYSRFSHAHSPIAASFLAGPPDFIDPSEYAPDHDFLAHLERDLSREKRNVILSSEHLSSRVRSVEHIEALGRALNTFQVYVIFYVRAQDELHFSSYSTALINGRREKLTDREIRIDNDYLNFVELLKPWAHVFGRRNIILRDYRNLVHNDVCDDFMNLLGVPHPSRFTRVPRTNRSLTPKIAEIIRRLNSFLPRHGEVGYAIYSASIQLRWLITSLIRFLCRDDRIDESPMKSKIKRTFDQSNRELFKTYGHDIKPQERAHRQLV